MRSDEDRKLDYLPAQLEQGAQMAEDLRTFAARAPKGHYLTSQQFERYRGDLVNCFGSFNRLYVWLCENDHEQDARALHKARQTVLGDLREAIELTYGGSMGRWPDKVNDQVINLARSIEAVTSRFVVATDCLPENVFKRRGDRWSVKFGGDLVWVNDLDGMGYIHYLVGKPNKDVPVIELYRSRHPAVPDPRRMVEGCNGEGLDCGMGEDHIADSEYLRSCHGRVGELRAEIKRARQDEDEPAETRAQAELDQVLGLVRQATRPSGKTGRSRNFRTELTKPADNVRKSIRTALNRIKRHHPKLYEHLVRSIQTGTACRYAPEGPIDWEL